MISGISSNVSLGSFKVNFPPKNPRAANVSLNTASIQECVERVLYFGAIRKVSLLIQPRVLYTLSCGKIQSLTSLMSLCACSLSALFFDPFVFLGAASLFAL